MIWYCGIGTISVSGAESEESAWCRDRPPAIEDARRNARHNGMENVEFFVEKLKRYFQGEYEKNQVYADVIVVDPPRKARLGQRLPRHDRPMQPKRVVYVIMIPHLAR